MVDSQPFSDLLKEERGSLKDKVTDILNSSSI
jgi:hypothetical protein